MAALQNINQIEQKVGVSLKTQIRFMGRLNYGFTFV